MPVQKPAMAVPMSQRNLRPPSTAQKEIREIYILVMGLTGAGKSTFISVVTEDSTIPIGDPGDLDSVTDKVQDYIVNIPLRGSNIIYEVHLIDSPGFDDGTVADCKVLTRIADFVNTHYKLKNTLAGVLYLHDITKAKMGGVGERNLRMLENMVGNDKWDNCTLVTTKWGCTTDRTGEEAREQKLMNKDNYFGEMLHNGDRTASMMRFDPKSKGRALEIIKPHLKRNFEPLISREMVDPEGPMLSLGETSAGRIVADQLEALEKMGTELKEVSESRQLLGRKFDVMLFEKYKAKRDKLMREQKLHRAGRWATRTAIVGGAIAATIVTFGPGASAFALEPAYETYANKQRSDDKENMVKLEKDYEQENQANLSPTGGFNAQWVRDKRVKSMDDLADNYSIRSSSSLDLVPVETLAETATEVSTFAIKDAGIP
ncbi:MAG: hypothetical protein Q9174_005229 [Haloplaca sp. 1 TL-2023]